MTIKSTFEQVQSSNTLKYSSADIDDKFFSEGSDLLQSVETCICSTLMNKLLLLLWITLPESRKWVTGFSVQNVNIVQQQ